MKPEKRDDQAISAMHNFLERKETKFFTGLIDDRICHN